MGKHMCEEIDYQILTDHMHRCAYVLISMFMYRLLDAYFPIYQPRTSLLSR